MPTSFFYSLFFAIFIWRASTRLPSPPLSLPFALPPVGSRRSTVTIPSLHPTCELGSASQTQRLRPSMVTLVARNLCEPRGHEDGRNFALDHSGDSRPSLACSLFLASDAYASWYSRLLFSYPRSSGRIDTEQQSSRDACKKAWLSIYFIFAPRPPLGTVELGRGIRHERAAW